MLQQKKKILEITGKFSDVLGIPKHHVSTADREHIYVGERQGQHVQIKRAYSPAEKDIKNVRPEVGESYLYLIAYCSGIPTIHSNATIVRTFHDDGAENALIISAEQHQPYKSELELRARETPGFIIPDMVLGA